MMERGSNMQYCRGSNRRSHGTYLCLDPSRQTCLLRGETIPLTCTEFAILQALMENRGKIVPTEELSNAVWRDAVSFGRNGCLAVHIRHIREKLHDRKPYATVRTAWGRGYWIE